MKEKKAVKKITKAKKPVKKPRIGLDPKGIAKLEKIMLANGKYFYNQRTYGKPRQYVEGNESENLVNTTVHACGTELCAAGFARLLAVGPQKLEKEVKVFDNRGGGRYTEYCVTDGKKLLGVSEKDRYGCANNCPDIFQAPGDWPYDLENRFNVLDGKPMSQIRCYIRILKTRANSDGSLTYKGDRRY